MVSLPKALVACNQNAFLLRGNLEDAFIARIKFPQGNPVHIMPSLLQGAGNSNCDATVQQELHSAMTLTG